MYIKQNLFSNQQLRGLKLAVLLNHGEEPCDYTHICRHLHCSFLTLQTEIAHNRDCAFGFLWRSSGSPLCGTPFGSSVPTRIWSTKIVSIHLK